MGEGELIPHLFRQEFRNIVAVLARQFGSGGLSAAEDIASETFATALQVWPYKGVPPNPVAWLYKVAKNKALNERHRKRLFEEKVGPEVAKQRQEFSELEMTEQTISDSLLQMMFAVCHPSLPPEGQIALALRTLCGFGIDEIASAFLASRETIIKRLHRTREKIRAENIEITVPDEAAIGGRLHQVLTTLYLLFSEGYHSESNDVVLREELCLEAMRLTHMLLNNPITNSSEANALLALMCFHASRFPARRSGPGGIMLYDDQDPACWDQNLIARGAFHLHKSTGGQAPSKFHVEAAIAYWHTVRDEKGEKWPNILSLYDQLLQLEYSPVASLNRVFAVFKVHGADAALAELDGFDEPANPYYYALLGELLKDSDPVRSVECFRNASELVRSEPEKEQLRRKISALERQ